MFNINLKNFKTTKIIFIILLQDLNFFKIYEHDMSPLIFLMHKNCMQ